MSEWGKRHDEIGERTNTNFSAPGLRTDAGRTTTRCEPLHLEIEPCDIAYELLLVVD